ncbi:MAG TPA: DNA-directed RNA polymerase subunit alpha C-terminal domain-containing protein, partial [Candidatus Paceibacterota bacterium]
IAQLDADHQAALDRVEEARRLVAERKSATAAAKEAEASAERELEEALKAVDSIAQNRVVEWRQIAALSQTYAGNAIVVPSKPDHDKCVAVLEQYGVLSRQIKSLKEGNIPYLGDLVQRSEDDLLKVPGMTPESIKDIRAALAILGLSLGVILEDWERPQPPALVLAEPLAAVSALTTPAAASETSPAQAATTDFGGVFTSGRRSKPEAQPPAAAAA